LSSRRDLLLQLLLPLLLTNPKSHVILSEVAHALCEQRSRADPCISLLSLLLPSALRQNQNQALQLFVPPPTQQKTATHSHRSTSHKRFQENYKESHQYISQTKKNYFTSTP
jgi:hypothetical protein